MPAAVDIESVSELDSDVMITQGLSDSLQSEF